MDYIKKGYVYLLLSLKDQRSYVGSTPNIIRRLKEHEKGKCKSTKDRRPFKLLYQEEYDTLAKARVRERYLKTRNGRRELKKIFEKLNNPQKPTNKINRRKLF
jgi:putative endonuclease